MVMIRITITKRWFVAGNWDCTVWFYIVLYRLKITRDSVEQNIVFVSYCLQIGDQYFQTINSIKIRTNNRNTFKHARLCSWCQRFWKSSFSPVHTDPKRRRFQMLRSFTKGLQFYKWRYLFSNVVWTIDEKRKRISKNNSLKLAIGTSLLISLGSWGWRVSRSSHFILNPSPNCEIKIPEQCSGESKWFNYACDDF
jgi:hypothetical protein